MTAESKTVEPNADNNPIALVSKEQLQQKTLISNIYDCIHELERQNLAIENFPKEFLKFLEKILHIIRKGERNAFLDFLNRALPKLFTQKSLQDTKRKSIIKIEHNLVVVEVESNTRRLASLAEKLQTAIQETIRKTPEKQVIMQLKEAFIQEITTKLSSIQCDKEQKERWIRGIKELLGTLINSYHEKRLRQNNADALGALNFFMGANAPTSTALSSGSSSTSHSNPSERSRSSAPPVASEIKTSPLRNNNLVKAINTLTGAICQHYPEGGITNKEMMETIRKELEEICKSELSPSVKIIVPGDFYRYFEDLIKAIGRKKSADKKTTDDVQIAFKNLCKFISISEESTPKQAAEEIERLSGEGGEFEYSALSIRKYGKDGANLLNIVSYLKDVLARELEMEEVEVEELEEVAAAPSSCVLHLLPITPFFMTIESKTATPQPQSRLQPPLNLGKAINTLTGEICQQKGITDREGMQKIRDMLVTKCAKHGAVEEITQENLFNGFRNLVREINKSNSDKAGIEKRKEAFQNFCNVLHIAPNSSIEAATDRVHALFIQGGEFEYSTLPTLEMPILSSPSKKLEILLKEELPQAFIEKTPEEIRAWEEEIRRQVDQKNMQLTTPESVSLENQKEKSKASGESASQNTSSHNFSSLLNLISKPANGQPSESSASILIKQ